MSTKRISQSKKPYRDFPLTFHAGSGQWCKKIRGHIFYFGKDADAAIKKYVDERDELQAGRIPRGRSSDIVTVRDVINHFLTYKKSCVATGELSERTFDQYLHGSELFIKQFGAHRAMEDLRQLDFTDYRAVLSQGRGLHDLSRQIRIARMICLYAQDQGLVEKVIRFGKTFREPSRKTLRISRQQKQARHGLRMFDSSELRAVLDAATQPLKAMILLGINCGFGASDCSSLPLSAVNFKSGWINFPRPKTGIDRRCPLWKETTAALNAARTVRPCPANAIDAHLVFITRRGNRWVRSVRRERDDGTTQLVTFDRVANEFAKVLKRLELKRTGLNFYAIRHTFRTIADESHDQPAVNFLMGHVDNSMAERYRERIGDERLHAVVGFVRNWLFPSSNST